MDLTKSLALPHTCGFCSWVLKVRGATLFPVQHLPGFLCRLEEKTRSGQSAFSSHAYRVPAMGLALQ